MSETGKPLPWTKCTTAKAHVLHSQSIAMQEGSFADVVHRPMLIHCHSLKTVLRSRRASATDRCTACAGLRYGVHIYTCTNSSFSRGGASPLVVRSLSGSTWAVSMWVTVWPVLVVFRFALPSSDLLQRYMVLTTT